MWASQQANFTSRGETQPGRVSLNIQMSDTTMQAHLQARQASLEHRDYVYGGNNISLFYRGPSHTPSGLLLFSLYLTIFLLFTKPMLTMPSL